MGGKEKHRWVLIKNILGAIAMMHIPIHDEYFLKAVFLLKISGPNSYIIEYTKAAGSIPMGMVTRGADKTKGIANLTGYYRVYGLKYPSCGQAGYLKRIGTDRNIWRMNKHFPLAAGLLDMLNILGSMNLGYPLFRSRPGLNWEEMIKQAPFF
jgi:hypothetical protein